MIAMITRVRDEVRSAVEQLLAHGTCTLMDGFLPRTLTPPTPRPPADLDRVDATLCRTVAHRQDVTILLLSGESRPGMQRCGRQSAPVINRHDSCKGGGEFEERPQIVTCAASFPKQIYSIRNEVAYKHAIGSADLV